MYLQVFMNLPVILRFLMVFEEIRKLSPHQLIQLYKLCYDITCWMGNKETRKEVCHRLGRVYYSIPLYNDAMEWFKQVLHISKETDDLSSMGEAYGNIGIVHYGLGQYQDATRCHKEHLRICQETGDISGEGYAYCNIGLVHQSLGQYEDAMKYHKKHLRICQETEDISGEGNAYGNIGVLHEHLGQYQHAMKYHKKHLRICQTRGDISGEGKAYGNIGNVHQNLGEREDALTFHKEDLRICQKTGDLAGQGEAYVNLGAAHYYLRQYSNALKYLKKAWRICRKTGHISGEGGAYGNMGLVLHCLGLYREAMECFEAQLRICQKIGDMEGEARSNRSIGAIWIKLHDKTAAEVSLTQSLNCYEKLFISLQHNDDSKVSIVDTYIEAYKSLAYVLIASGRKQDALLVLERGRAQALRDKLMMKYKISAQLTERTQVGNEDIASLVDISNTSFLMYSLIPFKRMYTFTTARDMQLCLKVMSREDINVLIRNQSNEDLDAMLDSNVMKLIQYMNDYAMRTPSISCEDRSLGPEDVDEKQPTKEEAFSASVALGQRGEPTEHSEDGNTTCNEHQKVPTTHDNVQNLHTTHVQNVNTTHENVQNLTTTHDNVESSRHPQVLRKVPKNRTSSTNPTVEKHSNIDQNIGAPIDVLLTNLYQVFIAPVKDELTQPDIAIIPDGPLFLLPFAALKNSEGKYLSDYKRIRVGPSLTTLKLLRECPDDRYCKHGALIVGGPAKDVIIRGERERIVDLPFAKEEAEKIAAVLGVTELTGESATKDAVQRRKQEGVAIIHIATHCSTTGKILLAPGPRVENRIPVFEDYLLTINDIYSSRINARLVVLSCCHSGRGEIKAEGVVGLTRAFLAAGARSVLASLWSVDDRATVKFMEYFYGYLKSGESASASLQQAMRKMRQSKDFYHPYYWAAFFIVGDDITLTP